MTTPVKKIDFTDKEYAKALESLVNREIDIMLEKMRVSFESKEYVDLINNYCLAYTSINAVRKYFIFSKSIEEINPHDENTFKLAKENNWLGNWPNESQIKLISKAYNPGDFILSGTESKQSTVLTLDESNNWKSGDFSSRPAFPVSVKNLEESDLKSVLFLLFEKGYSPIFDIEQSNQTVLIAEVISQLKSFDLSKKTVTINASDLNDLNLSSEVNELVKKTLLKSMELQPGFTANDVKNYLKKSDFLRCQLPNYDEGYFSLENEWLWELNPEPNPRASFPIPEGDIGIWTRDPHEDINENSIIAIDFGTSSTVVVEYNPKYPDKPRQICVGSQKDGKYENPTLLLVKKYGEFLSSYYSKDFRPYTKWDDLMVSHEVKNRMGNAENNEFKAVLSHIKQWAANTEVELCFKPAEEKDPVYLKPLKELFSKKDNEDFNPIEIYAYFLGLYLNNRREDFGIYLNYQLSYPATYDEEIVKYIRQSFENGIKKSLPAAIVADREIKVEMKTSEPEAYAVTAMRKYRFEPENDEKVKYAIFDFGGGTSDFAYGCWSKPDEGELNKENKIQTLHVYGEKYLGGENILDGLAFKVFSDPRNLPKLKVKGKTPESGDETVEKIFKFSYGIERKQRNDGVDSDYISSNFYARNNMAKLIDWNVDAEVDSENNEVLIEGKYFNKGLREFWENQEKYFDNYFSVPNKSNESLILINQIRVILEKVTDSELKKELESILDQAINTDNPIDRKSIENTLMYVLNKNRDKIDDISVKTKDEYVIQPTLYYQTESECNFEPVEIIISKQMMYKYFCEEINEGIDSFFNEMKTAFSKHELYNGNIKIFLAGNASKSPILHKLMEERIEKEKNENVSFDLFNRFDSDDYYENLEKVMKSQGWDDEDIRENIDDERKIDPKYQPTGKTGVAFGIVEMLKGKIQVVSSGEKYFKYYLGDCKHIHGKDRFVIFPGFNGQKPVYPDGDWVETFSLPESNSPQTINLYYTTKGVNVGKQSIDVASAYPLTIPKVGKNEKIFVKAAGVDKIFCVPAIDTITAEDKLKNDKTGSYSIYLKE